MIIKLHLNVKRGDAIPINYQWELSSALYRIIQKADVDYATFLHDSGFRVENKLFKMFCFSPVRGKMFFENGALFFQDVVASVEVRFLVEKSAENFIIGVFKDQTFDIANKNQRATFSIKEVTAEPLPLFSETMRFTTSSPMVVSTHNERNYADYLSPSDARYENLLWQNLLEKSRAMRLPSLSEIATHPFKFHLLSEPKSKLITLKAGTSQQTKVKGYLYEFSLTAHPTLLRIGYLAGFGEKNAQGFGLVQVSKVDN